MTTPTPRPWLPGERISARRLNVDQAEAMRARRQVGLGAGSSIINDLMGNQSANHRKNMLFLVRAQENFRIQSNTDLYSYTDDCPSGMVLQIRLNKHNSTHEVETLASPFRVWDVLPGLEDLPTKCKGDSFYTFYNLDSNRWEVLPAVVPENVLNYIDNSLAYVEDALQIVTGIVIECLGDGWHKVQLCDWNGCPTISSSASASLSASTSASDAATGPCDLCDEAVGDLSSDELETAVIEIDVERSTCEPIESTTNNEELFPDKLLPPVYAHTTNLRPMLVGGMIKMVRRWRDCNDNTALDGGYDQFSLRSTFRSSVLDPLRDSLFECSPSASASASSSASASESDEEGRLYDVVDGVWPLASLPFPVYECCTDPVSGAQTVQLIKLTRVVVEAVICDVLDDPCPESSSSASASASV